jgi:hypothetical protein
MSSYLGADTLDLILTSLEYSKRHFSEYQDYPSEEFKRARIASVEGVIAKIRALRRNTPK